jgi:hypothetical protein
MEKIMPGQRVKTSVSVDRDLWKSITVEAAQREVDNSDAVEDGLKLWLGEKRPESEFDGLSRVDRELLVRLTEFLRSDHPHSGDIRKVMSDMLNLFEKMSR